MKRLLCLIALGCTLTTGCTTVPVVMDNCFQRKTVTRCDNDLFCFRKTYDVAWDSSCQTGCTDQKAECGMCGVYGTGGYPVSYRSREILNTNDKNGYLVTLPAGGNISW